jgi:hypothetical protein
LVDGKNSEDSFFFHRPIRGQVALLLFIVFWCKKAVSKNKKLSFSTFYNLVLLFWCEKAVEKTKSLKKHGSNVG